MSVLADYPLVFVAGVVFVVVAHRFIEGHEVPPTRFEEADLRKFLLILGVLTVHSFPGGSR